MDRAAGHQDTLRQALGDKRIPAKLRINIKPFVVNKEDPEFIRDWDRAIRSCEITLAETIIKHLDRVVQESNETTRRLTKDTLSKLLTILPDNATATLGETLKEAQQERTTKRENCLKCNREFNTATNNNKKTKTDN